MSTNTRITLAVGSVLTLAAIALGTTLSGPSSTEVKLKQANQEAVEDVLETTSTTSTTVAPQAAPPTTPTTVKASSPATTRAPARPVEERVSNLETRTSQLEQTVASTAPPPTVAPSTTTTRPPPTVPPRPCVVGRNCPGDAG